MPVDTKPFTSHSWVATSSVVRRRHGTHVEAGDLVVRRGLRASVVALGGDVGGAVRADRDSLGVEFAAAVGEAERKAAGPLRERRVHAVDLVHLEEAALVHDDPEDARVSRIEGRARHIALVVARRGR